MSENSSKHIEPMTEEEQFALLQHWLGCSDPAGRRLWFAEPRRGGHIGLHFKWIEEARNRRNGYVEQKFRWQWNKMSEDDRVALINLALLQVQTSWKRVKHAREETVSWESAQGFIGKSLRWRLKRLIWTTFRAEYQSDQQRADWTEERAKRKKQKAEEALSGSHLPGQPKGRDGGEWLDLGQDDIPPDPTEDPQTNPQPEGAIHRGRNDDERALLSLLDEGVMPTDPETESDPDGLGLGPEVNTVPSPLSNPRHLQPDVDVTDLCAEILMRFAAFLRDQKARVLLPLLTCLSRKHDCPTVVDTLTRKRRHGQKGTAKFEGDLEIAEFAECMDGGDVYKSKQRLCDQWDLFSASLMADENDAIAQALGLLQAIHTLQNHPDGREPRNWSQDNE